MFRTNRPFFITLVCCWAALIIASHTYLTQDAVLHSIVSAALPAFLLEVTFYLAAMFESTRNAFSRISSRRSQAGLLWISALIPYLAFSVAEGTFARNAFYLIAALTAVFSLWYAILPIRFAYDAGFVVMAAAPILLRVFPRIYVSPDPRLHLDVLGHLMWIRIGVLALLVLREWKPGPFSLWPSTSEWRSGFVWFLVSVVPIAGLALALDDVHFEPAHGGWWQIAGIGAGTFFGILWVVALGEELFFRGLIQRALLNVSASPIAAIVLSAILFGASHLWFHQFPNWRRASVAAVLGLACGIAYWRTGSVRAPMVTHAMVVTTWRVLFSR